MSNTTRRELLEVCALIYDRGLTDAAGSNFSVRASDTTLFATAAGNARRTRLHMSPDDLLHVTLEGERLEGAGQITSSWPTHQKLMQSFPEIGAVIHAHPKYTLGFACTGLDMPPLSDALKPIGAIPTLPRDLVVDSEPFGDAIVEIFRSLGERLGSQGAGVLYPYHGVLVAASTLEGAYDVLERIEYNAFALQYRPVWSAEDVVPEAAPHA